MTTEVQGVLFYTQEEMDAKTSDHTIKLVRELALQNDKTSNGIIEVLKSEIREGNIEKDYANALYREFCDNVGLVHKEITTTYTVTVSYQGTEVAKFGGVEASDEDDACDNVRDNMGTDDIEVTMTLSFNDDTEYGSVSLSSYELELDFDYEAEEE